jgi:diguanylate cyclase (GGDEF)-like protein
VRTAGRILVVDDIADNRRLLSVLFKRRGFDVIEAENGRDALSLIACDDFDLALLDISMPDMDGIELLKSIRSRHSPAHLPVIMVTARTETDDLMVAFKFGASDYVTKPVNLPVLVARAENQLTRKRSEERLQQALSDIASLNVELRGECARRAEAEARALDLAYHDALTGLANRLRFREVLAAALTKVSDSAGPLGLLCLDLDGFKPVNDRLGHPAGDDLLRAVADRLRGCVWDTDIVSRLGGDEFAIVLPSMKSPADATALAERVLDVISTPFTIEAHQVKVGCSAGIALAFSPDVDPDRFFREADAALYSAKTDGRGTWRVSPEFMVNGSYGAPARGQLSHSLPSQEFG